MNKAEKIRLERSRMTGAEVPVYLSEQQLEFVARLVENYCEENGFASERPETNAKSRIVESYLEAMRLNQLPKAICPDCNLPIPVEDGSFIDHFHANGDICLGSTKTVAQSI